jgi:hypothetical protein
MANSGSSNVVKEGDEVYKREESEFFVRRGLGFVLYACQQGECSLGKKRSFTAQWEVEPESRRRDDDAGPLRETRGTRKEKRQIEMSSADESTGLALAFVGRWAINICGSGSSGYWNFYN